MPASMSIDKAVIANGATTSGAVDLRGKTLLAVETPAAFTGVTLSFSVCDTEDGTYIPVRHLNVLASTAFTLTSVSTSQHIVIASSLMPKGFGNCFVKVISGSAEGAARTLNLYSAEL